MNSNIQYSVATNIKIPYDLRCKAGSFGLNISEITRNALRVKIESLEQENKTNE